jgi:hypothetical protein
MTRSGFDPNVYMLGSLALGAASWSAAGADLTDLTDTRSHLRVCARPLRSMSNSFLSCQMRVSGWHRCQVTEKRAKTALTSFEDEVEVWEMCKKHGTLVRVLKNSSEWKELDQEIIHLEKEGVEGASNVKQFFSEEPSKMMEKLSASIVDSRAEKLKEWLRACKSEYQRKIQECQRIDGTWKRFDAADV